MFICDIAAILLLLTAVIVVVVVVVAFVVSTITDYDDTMPTGTAPGLEIAGMFVFLLFSLFFI